MNFWERKNGYDVNNSGTSQKGNSYAGQNYNRGTNGGNYGESKSDFSHSEQNNGNYSGDRGQNINGSVGIEDEIRRFSGMSNDELTAELISRASTSRANGTLDTVELEKFYSVATMFMNTDQLTRLRALLNMLEK